MAIAYIIAQINDLKYGPERNEDMGHMIVYFIIGAYIINLTIITLSFAKGFKLKIMRCRNKRRHAKNLKNQNNE